MGWPAAAAPSIYHTILSRGQDILVPLGRIATIRRGCTTGANDFFFIELIDEQHGIATIRCGDGSQHQIESHCVTRPIVVNTRQIACPTIEPAALKHRLLQLDEASSVLPHAHRLIQWGRALGYDRRRTMAGRQRWYELPARPPAPPAGAHWP